MALEISCMYPLIFDDKIISTTDYVDLANAVFCMNDVSSMLVAELRIYVDMNGSSDPLSARVYDDDSQESIGEITSITTSGITSFLFTKPLEDCLLKIQAKKNAVISTDPIIRAGFIRYAPDTET